MRQETSEEEGMEGKSEMGSRGSIVSINNNSNNTIASSPPHDIRGFEAFSSVDITLMKTRPN